MKRLLTDLAQTVGLTVTATKTYGGDYVAFHFNNDTAIILRSRRDWEDTTVEVEAEPDPHGGEVVPLGLSTVAEWNEGVDRMRAERDARIEKAQLAEYERLKAKFGGGK